MAKQLDGVLPANKGNFTKSTVGGLGGTIGIRVILDDTVITSKADADRLLQALEQRIIEDTWPMS